MHVNDLLRLDGRSFVEAAYLAILKRQVDQSGMDHYMGRLALGDGKEAVLFALATSLEATGSRIDVVGLNQLLKGHRKSSWKRFILSFFDVASSQRRFARIEHMIAQNQELLLDIAKNIELHHSFSEIQASEGELRISRNALKDTLLNLQKSLADKTDDADEVVGKFRRTIRASALVFTLDR